MASYSKGEAREWAWETLKGEWTTLITPFTPDDRFDEEGMRRNIRHIRSLGTRGGGCSWGMGEFWSLTKEERFRLLDVVADEAAGKWPIGAQVTHTSAGEMLELARRAEDVGYDLLIVAAPYIEAKTEQPVIDWVRILAENTNLAIMFYNSPQFGIVMSPAGLKQICQLPNVVGVKEASFNQQLSIETHLTLGKDHVISTPDEWIYWKANELGFCQQVMFANTSDWRFDLPGANYYVQFIDKCSDGNLDEAFYEQHVRALKELSDAWWARLVNKHNGPLPVQMVKYWGTLMGLATGHARPPLMPLAADEKDELRRELEPLKPRRPVVTVAPRDQRTAWLTGNNNFNSGMLLMVSVQNVDEALEAERGGADVVDVKNLQEALVGSGHPNLVQEVRAKIQPENHVSVTLGVVPTQPGTVAMAVYAAALLQATSVKVGFCKAEYDEALEVLRQSRRALDGSNTKLVGSLFADNHLYDGLDPRHMNKLARESDCDGWLIDTLTKDGRNLFDFMTEPELQEMVFEGKELGMSTSLSGHLKIDDLDELGRINPDIVGVRGAVCAGEDRQRSVAWEAVAEFKRQLDLRKSGEIDVRASVPVVQNGNNGWVIIDGRGKSCAGIIAALTYQVQAHHCEVLETLLGDALNIYDVIAWANKGGHHLLTQRKDSDGTVRVLIQPTSNEVR